MACSTNWKGLIRHTSELMRAVNAQVGRRMDELYELY